MPEAPQSEASATYPLEVEQSILDIVCVSFCAEITSSIKNCEEMRSLLKARR